MPINPNAAIEVTALAWVPPLAQGLVKDLRVRWALEEAGFDYRVRLLGGERPSDYVKEQAFDQVPSFRDGAVQFFESGAIVQYIGEKSEALLPRDPQGKYRAIQWSYAAVNSVEPAVQNRVLLDSFYADEEWAKLYTPTADQFARLRLKRVSDRLAGKPLAGGRSLHDRRPDDDHGASARRLRRTARRYPEPGRVHGARTDAPGVSDRARRPTGDLSRQRTERRSSMSYIDGFILPLKDEKLDQYRTMAETFARKAAQHGAIGSVELLGDGLEHGHTTDFYRAVQAQDGENVVFSFVVWPSKDVRDAAWEKIMADPEMQPGAQPMPFDGKRMFWGGFKPFAQHA